MSWSQTSFVLLRVQLWGDLCLVFLLPPFPTCPGVISQVQSKPWPGPGAKKVSRRWPRWLNGPIITLGGGDARRPPDVPRSKRLRSQKKRRQQYSFSRKKSRKKPPPALRTMIRVADDLRLGRWRSGGKGPYQGRAPFVNPHLTKGAAGRPQLGRPAAQHQDIEAKKKYSNRSAEEGETVLETASSYSLITRRSIPATCWWPGGVAAGPRFFLHVLF